MPVSAQGSPVNVPLCSPGLWLRLGRPPWGLACVTSLQDQEGVMFSGSRQCVLCLLLSSRSLEDGVSCWSQWCGLATSYQDALRV